MVFITHNLQSILLGDVHDGLSWGNYTSQQAKDALQAITHPEARQIIDSLQSQMNSGKRVVSFYSRNLENVRNPLVFSSQYQMGAKSTLQNLLQVAHPDYKPIRTSGGSIVFGKND